MTLISEEPQVAAFRLEAHQLSCALHSCLVRLQIVEARRHMASLFALSQLARNEIDVCTTEHALDYSGAMMAETLALLGKWQEAAALADRTWIGLEEKAARRAACGVVPRNNSIVRAAVISVWSQIAWQHPQGTFSQLMDVRQLCQRYLSIRELVGAQLADNSEASIARREHAKPALLHSGVCVAKAAYRHSRRHVRLVVRVINQQDGAALRLGKHHFKHCPPGKCPWYFDFEICKGLVDADLSLAD